MTAGSEPEASQGEPRRLERITQRRWAWIGVVVWVVLIGIASPLAQKLANVEDNQAVNYLPGNAQSTKAFQELQSFPSAKNATAIAVWVAKSGTLTKADLATVAAARTAIADHVDISGPASPVAVSKDGKAAAVEVNLPFPQTAKGTSTQHSVDVLDNAYDRMKAQVTPTSTLQTGIAGPAAIAAQSNTAFKGIDGILILAAGLVVAVLLLLIYRSPILWLIPLLTSGLALELAQGVVYTLARHAGLTVTGLSAGILNVLVFGAGTDYALLLIARYREELHYHEKAHIALAIALRRAAPAMIASASTVILGLLCLLAATLNSDRGLGPVAAVGVACAILAAITLLPALLAVCGRRIFWPFIPRVEAVPPHAGLWTRVADTVERRHRPAWIGLVVILGACCIALSAIQLGLPNNDSFTNNPPPVRAQRLLDAHFPSGTGNPADIVTATAAVSQVEQVARATPGVASVTSVEQHGDRTHLEALLADGPDSSGADHTIVVLRDRLGHVAGAGALVGGQTAIDMDTNNAASHDRDVVIPLILVVVAIILALLLRAILAPILLILTVMLSFAAALGVSAVVFRYVFHFAGVDQTVPLYAFLFLVALGVDYNIFLMTRIREESTHGPTMEAIHTGLARTGGVITSAGLILAATFAVLGVLPLTVLAEVGFTVAFGILLDTFLVRSVLVPALCWEIGPSIWWPSKLRLTSR